MTTNISTTHILTSSLSTTTTSKISTTAATNNLSNTHSSNTAIKPSSNDIRKSQIKKNAVPNNPEHNQNKLLASNIPPAASTEDKSLAAIFPFDLNEITPIPLFSGAVLNTKPIMAMYTDAKVDGQPIKLILDTLVGNNWLSKTNATLDWTTQELQISQNGQYIMPLALLIELEEEKKKPNWEAYQSGELTMIKMNYQQPGSGKKITTKEKGKRIKKFQHQPLFTMHILTHYYNQIIIDQSLYALIAARNYNTPCLTCRKTLSNKRMWNDIPGHGRMCNKMCQYMILINNWVCKGTLIDDAWKQVLIASRKTEGATTSELLEIKNNSPSLPEPKYVQTFDIFGNIENNPEEFHKHYQQLAPTREEQKQCLEEINT
ncbi:hypothetical protein G9A89_001538 [Geosiphon pyriformis]|nr:hypothetical protein G9A89_001538 [Geosiphon pyriformis]